MAQKKYVFNSYWGRFSTDLLALLYNTFNPEQFISCKIFCLPLLNIHLKYRSKYNSVCFSIIFSADPQFQSSVINTNVIVSSNGEVVWLSHGIYRSSCDINVEYFPFDLQSCQMKWASWTYDGYQVKRIFLYSIRSRIVENQSNIVYDRIRCPHLYIAFTNYKSALHTPFAKAKVSALVTIMYSKHSYLLMSCCCRNSLQLG